MISQEKFIADFKNQLFDNPDDINLDTDFRDLYAWDSLTAMAVIVMLDDEYKIKISDKKFAELKTVGDIYNLINE